MAAKPSSAANRTFHGASNQAWITRLPPLNGLGTLSDGRVQHRFGRADPILRIQESTQQTPGRLRVYLPPSITSPAQVTAATMLGKPMVLVRRMMA